MTLAGAALSESGRPYFLFFPPRSLYADCTMASSSAIPLTASKSRMAHTSGKIAVMENTISSLLRKKSTPSHIWKAASMITVITPSLICRILALNEKRQIAFAVNSMMRKSRYSIF